MPHKPFATLYRNTQTIYRFNIGLFVCIEANNANKNNNNIDVCSLPTYLLGSQCLSVDMLSLRYKCQVSLKYFQTSIVRPTTTCSSVADLNFFEVLSNVLI